MLALFALLLATAFPSMSKTSWMSPESFHLTVGMPRAAAMQTLQEGGWKPRQGDHKDEVIVDYTGTRALTLEFHKDRLRSIRFELFDMLSEIGGAFAEEKATLHAAFGEPKKLRSKTILLYDGRLPNVMVVVGADPKSENGKKGLGLLTVRYYDPRPSE